ncbi:transcriptional regulator with XRE-family HTH domain [Streptomyces sp. 3330]|uniref:helix-turn-helix domain-containing protein n=1 Tax=Streptomyces sp. 3330 TaxID=2817755 RepID=UPI002855D85A|nr:helix-turn-helix transcriptional regulator [Streptomyces sp. 3330]MDR6974312.1 transcriptional regulator with XRE-family HTH domain [Streptomyces sp. 3330]
MENLVTLGGFLRASRSRLEPADVGFPTTTRRRVAGLRREELAQLAGVSVDYYTRFEQGRSKTASRAVLDALAAALHLDESNAPTCSVSPLNRSEYIAGTTRSR